MSRKSDYLKAAKAKHALYEELFSLPAGKAVFEDLFQEFFQGSPIGATTDDTLINLGKAEVIRYIMDWRKVTIKDVEDTYGRTQPGWEPDR